MTGALRLATVSRTKRSLRVLTRTGLVTALFATAAIVTSAVGPGAGRTIEAAADPLYGAGGEYHSLEPDRILDTRQPAPLDVAPFGAKQSTTPTSDATFDVPIVGMGGLPAFVDANGDCVDDNVLAVAVNITVVDPTQSGFLRAWGVDAPEGNSSVVNFNKGQAVPNSAVLRPGCDGKLRVRVFTPVAATAHVLIDVFGWVSTSSYTGGRGARIEPAGPGRIFDSREVAFGGVALGPQGQRTISIRGADSVTPPITDVVPDSADVVGVLVNVTGVAGAKSTFVSVLPQPLAAGQELKTSNLNLRPNQIRSNLAIVPVGADGTITLFNLDGSTHVILDVMGYFIKRDDNSRRGRIVPLVSPFRAFDTREAAHFDTPLGPANSESWDFAAFKGDVKIEGQPVGSQLGLLGNLTAAGLGRQYSYAPSASFVTAYPTPTDAKAVPPLVSNLGILEGEVVPNLVMLAYGSTGDGVDRISFYNRAGYLDYLLDVSAVILAD